MGCKINFNDKGLVQFTPEQLLHDSALIFESDISNNKPKAPFIKNSIKANLKLTLVIDLDETLIHYPEGYLDDLDSSFVNVDHVKVRPFTQEFLERIFESYEIIIFTAASQNYADPIIDFIDKKKLVSHRLYRQHLTLHNNKLIKDLSKIGRELNRTMILDNLPENFILQQENGIYIKSWFGDPEDSYLLLLLKIFIYVAENMTGNVQELLLEFKNIWTEELENNRFK